MSEVKDSRIADILGKLPEAQRRTAEAQAEYRLARYNEQRARRTAYWQEYQTKNRERVAALKYRAQRRRAKLKRAPPMERQLALDAIRKIQAETTHCHYCRRPLDNGDVTIDHVIPLSKGGRHEPSNLVGACHRCNRLKGAQLNWQPHPWHMHKP